MTTGLSGRIDTYVQIWKQRRARPTWTHTETIVAGTHDPYLSFLDALPGVPRNGTLHLT